MSPLDPGKHWLAAGITGLARQREWDAVATAEASGAPGDEVELVALPEGRLLLENGPSVDLTPFADALATSIEPPYRAVAVCREDFWAVGARAIDVARLDPDPRGDDLELTWDGATLALLVDGMPADPAGAAALQRLAAKREAGPYAAHAHRIEGQLWEVLVLAL